MRIIQCRGIDRSTHNWVFGQPVYNQSRKSGLSVFPEFVQIVGRYDIENDVPRVWDVYPDSVGQYTEFEDGENNPIYEGDIVLIGGELGFEVVHRKGMWAVENTATGTVQQLNHFTASECKIIGNVIIGNICEWGSYDDDTVEG